jgi:hypothetical protein
MADLSLTAANVVPGSGAVIVHGTAGATITAGQVVYLDSADNRYKLADCDNATAAIRAAVGIAVNGAASGQPIAIQIGGELALGTVLTAGVAYYLSPTAGGIAPIADILSGDHTVLVGLAKSTSILTVSVKASGAALA